MDHTSDPQATAFYKRDAKGGQGGLASWIFSTDHKRIGLL